MSRNYMQTIHFRDVKVWVPQHGSLTCRSSENRHHRCYKSAACSHAAGHAAPDVPSALVDDLLQLGGSEQLLWPRLSQVPPAGHRGYFSVVTPSGPSAAQQPWSSRSSWTGDGSTQLWVARRTDHPARSKLGMQATARGLGSLQQDATQGQHSTEQRLLEQVEAASHWTQVDALLQRVGTASQVHIVQLTQASSNDGGRQVGLQSDLNQTMGAQQQQQATIGLAALERTLAKLCALHQASAGSMLASDDGWRGLGSLLSQLMAINIESFEPSTSTPIERQGGEEVMHSGSALQQAAAGSPAEAISILEAMAELGQPFYCQSYADAVVASVCRVLDTSAPPNPGLVARCFAACAACGHLMRRSQVTLLADSLAQQLGTMDAEGFANTLWAMSKYQVDVRQVHVAAGRSAAAAANHESAAAAGSMLSMAISMLQERSWSMDLTPAALGRILLAMHQFGVRPEPVWLDRCLSAAMSASRPHSSAAQGTHHAARTLGGAMDVLSLLQALVQLNYQPPPQVAVSVLAVIEDEMSAASHDKASCSILPATVVAQAVAQLAALQVQANARWCSKAVAAVLQAPGGAPGQVVCKLMVALPVLLGASSNHVSVKVWVSDNLAQLEVMIAAMSGYLRSASHTELRDLIVGCATIRYHPGLKFLNWHQAACLRHGRSFPWVELVQVRGAYSSLGFQPERRLVEQMELAQKQLQKMQRLQERRAAKAAVVAAAPSRQPQLQGISRQSKQAVRWSLQRKPAGQAPDRQAAGLQAPGMASISVDEDEGDTSPEEEIMAMLGELKQQGP